MHYFYPRSPCGERRKSNKLAGLKLVFLSTLSLRRATFQNQIIFHYNLFLSTLSLRRATEQSSSYNAYLAISIHALLAESDQSQLKPPVKTHNFYPRSPCGERLIEFRKLLYPGNFYPRSPCGERPKEEHTMKKAELFLSTLSLRRATAPSPPRREFYKISIHALLAESDGGGLRHAVHIRISIHALLAESDRAGLPDV